jgi:hypothetical protein
MYARLARPSTPAQAEAILQLNRQRRHSQKGVSQFYLRIRPHADTPIRRYADPASSAKSASQIGAVNFRPGIVELRISLVCLESMRAVGRQRGI